MGYYSLQPVCLHWDVILLGQSIRELLFLLASLFALGHYTPQPVHKRWVIIPLSQSVCNGDIILLGQSIWDGLLFPPASLFAPGHYLPRPVCLHQAIILLGRSVCNGVLFTLANPYVANHYSPHRAWLAHHQFRPTHFHQKIYVVRPTHCRWGTGRRRVARLRWHIVNLAVRSTMGVLYWKVWCHDSWDTNGFDKQLDNVCDWPVRVCKLAHNVCGETNVCLEIFRNSWCIWDGCTINM